MNYIIQSETQQQRQDKMFRWSNATIASAVNTMATEDKEWDKIIRNIQFTLNNMKNKTSKQSPHEVLFSFDSIIRYRNQKMLFEKQHKKPKKFKTGKLVLVEWDIQATEESRNLAAMFKSLHGVAEGISYRFSRSPKYSANF